MQLSPLKLFTLSKIFDLLKLFTLSKMYSLRFIHSSNIAFELNLEKNKTKENITKVAIGFET